MNTDEYYKIMEIERSGETAEALVMLKNLANKGDALALLDLSTRYYSIEGYAYPIEHIEPDHVYSEKLFFKAKESFEKLAADGSGEAMRMLANIYLGAWGPYIERSIENAETLLLKSIEANHFFSANELATLYLGNDIKKAKYYYQMAKEHNCLVIMNDAFET